MQACVIFLLQVCVLVHCQGTKNQSETELPAGSDAKHLTVHNGETWFSNIKTENENISMYFVSSLFRKYGGSTQNLTPDGFARMLCSLGLIPPLAKSTNEADDKLMPMKTGAHTDMVDCSDITFDRLQTLFDDLVARQAEHDHSDHEHAHDDHDEHKHQDDDMHNHEDHSHDHHDHSSENSSASSSTNHGRRKKRNADAATGPAPGLSDHSHTFDHMTCTSPQNLLELFHISKTLPMNASRFLHLCPALLSQIDSGVCKKLYQQPDHHEHLHNETESVAQLTGFSSIPGKVWGYSIAAVMVISLAGLLGLAVIPIMQKVFYNHLLQFLVAVAVGALSGDALLHLIPHAISENFASEHGSHDAHDHSTHDGHGVHDDSGGSEAGDSEHLRAVWKGLVALLCIFFFFLLERILTIVTEKKRRKKASSRQKKKHCERLCDVEKTGGVGAKLSAHQESNTTDCDQMVMVVHPNRALKGYADATHDVLLHQCDESLTQSDQTDVDDQHSSTIPFGHSHGHSHGHGHAHCDIVPGSVAAVAWMLVLGDGIHNFSDGLAIGAAFATSTTVGFSTSVAILCHELPHEIGDFVVLLRAGMSVKQAVVFNCISCLLCLGGMLVGVAIGNIHNASLWVFAGVGGMFLYISMVDMLPEMTAVDPKKGENQYLHLFFQVCGMMIGAGIMLIIAVYEHDLQQLMG